MLKSAMVPRVVDTAFLQHPPNPLQHSLSAFWQNRPKRRKVGDTLTATVTPDDAVVTYQWLADGEEIVGATEATLLVTSLMSGSRISVEVTDADGNTAVSDETDPVSNVAVEVSISDISGLQSDGTGLVGDTLGLSYGSALGVPQIVTWYYGEKVVKTATANAQSLDNVLTLDTGALGDFNGLLGAGEYYAVISNSEGEQFTSNTIELTYLEQPAEITGFAITDDLENPENITFAANDVKAVVTVTMAKAYAGDFYIYEDKIKSFSNANDLTTFDFDPDKVTTLAAIDGGNDGWVVMPVLSRMTEENVLDCVAGAGLFTGGAEKGLIYYGAEGTILMTATGDNYKRGKSYKVVFDQESLKDDDISGTARTDVEVSDPDLVDYLEAPAGVKLTTVTSGMKAKAEFVDAEGNVVKNLGDGTGLAGFDSVIVYGNSSASKGTSKDAQAGTIKEGVWTSGGNLKANNYYVLEAKTTPGVFAEKTATLTSEYKAKNVGIAEKVVLKENGSTPEQADLTFTGIVAPATVYVVSDKDLTDQGAAEFDPTRSELARGSVEVKAGQGTATIAGIFAKEDITNADSFTAYIVPEDTETYAVVTSEAFAIKPVATSLEYVDGNTTFDQAAEDGDAGADATTPYEVVFSANTNVKVLDQFGTATVSGAANVTEKSATVTVNNAGGIAESATANYSIENGQLTFTVARTSGVDIGDGFSIAILGSTFKIVAKNEIDQDADVDNSEKVYEVTMGADTLQKAATTNLTVSTAYNLNAALGSVANNYKVTVGEDITTTAAITVKAKTTLDIAAGKTLTLGKDGNAIKGTLDIGSTTGIFAAAGKTITAYDGAVIIGQKTAAKITGLNKLSIDSEATTNGVNVKDKDGTNSAAAGATFKYGTSQGDVAGTVVNAQDVEVGGDDTITLVGDGTALTYAVDDGQA